MTSTLLDEKTEGRWRADVIRFLELGGISQAKLAEHLEMPRALPNFYLTGKRRPPVDRVRQINVAVGELVNSADITAYLESLIALPIRRRGVLDRDMARAAKDGLLRALGRVEAYLRDGAAQEIILAFLALKPPRPQLAYDVNQAYRHELVGPIDGSAPKRLFIDVLTSIFKRYGIALEPWFVPRVGVRRLRASDELFRVIRFALARATEDVPLRNELERELLAAIVKYIMADRQTNTSGKAEQ